VSLIFDSTTPAPAHRACTPSPTAARPPARRRHLPARTPTPPVPHWPPVLGHTLQFGPPASSTSATHAAWLPPPILGHRCWPCPLTLAATCPLPRLRPSLPALSSDSSRCRPPSPLTLVAGLLNCRHRPPPPSPATSWTHNMLMMRCLVQIQSNFGSITPLFSVAPFWTCNQRTAGLCCRNFIWIRTSRLIIRTLSRSLLGGFRTYPFL
jgi:hypothetical protein